jgi:hypothetical protein
MSNLPTKESVEDMEDQVSGILVTKTTGIKGGNHRNPPAPLEKVMFLHLQRKEEQPRPDQRGVVIQVSF